MGGIVVLSLLALFGPGPGGGVSFTGGSPVIALVYVEGVLVTGPGSGTSLLGMGSSGSDAIVSTLADIEKDPAVKAVVLRVDSPGGSPAAAQEISEALARVRAAGKVVVTSMADVAASGAYWVAANTDLIVANPGTTTGSIGVIWEIPNYEELYRKLGIQYVTFTSGPHKDMGSPARELTDEERKIMRAMVEDLYNQFVDTVAQGRDMTREQVLALADGRVFTGSQAVAAGLVDRLGSLQAAIDEAASLAGIEEPYQVKRYGQKSPWEVFLGEVGSLLRALRLTAAGTGLAPTDLGPGFVLYGPPVTGGLDAGEGSK